MKNTLNKELLENIIGEINHEIYSTDLTEEKIFNRLSDFEDENGKLSLEKLNAFVLQESRDYTTIFVHDLLLRLYDEGYILEKKQ